MLRKIVPTVAVSLLQLLTQAEAARDKTQTINQENDYTLAIASIATFFMFAIPVWCHQRKQEQIALQKRSEFSNLRLTEHVKVKPSFAPQSHERRIPFAGNPDSSPNIIKQYKANKPIKGRISKGLFDSTARVRSREIAEELREIRRGYRLK